ncbi:MAG: hypothetical protein JWQ88_336 [Rhodoferax sp.]|nr:hypothetical protein [Rhodoferax sp.]
MVSQILSILRGAPPASRPARPDRALALLLKAACVLLPLCGASAQAQTACGAFDPVRNGAFIFPLVDWTNATWVSSGAPTGGVQYLNDTNPGSLTQTIYGVSPGSQIMMNMRWGNGQISVFDGNQVKLEVLYNNVVYATFLTSPFTNTTVSGGVGPATGAGYSTQNGATISPPFGVTNWGTPINQATYTITLPSTIPLSGVLLIRAARTESASSATDDIYLRSVAVDTATVCLRKVSQGGIGSFNFTSTGLDTDLITAGVQSPATIATATVNAPVAYDAANSLYSGVQPMVRTTTGGFTITESSMPAGYLLSSIACDAGTVSRTGDTATVSGLAALEDVTCTFTNAVQPQLRLQKQLPDGRVAQTDQFTLTIAGTGGPAVATTTGTASTATGVATLNPATIGSSYTLSEALVTGGGSVLADYTSTYACTNTLAGGQAPGSSGSSITLTPVAGDDLTCTISNAAVARSDLAIVKTSSAPTLQSGAVVTYTISATNNGPSAANGAVVRDTPGAGLDCTTPSPTATCTATGGALCPSATVPVASLLGPGGVTIATMPSGGNISMALQCVVTATGTP